MPELIKTIVIAAIPIILAITLHEAAHGYVARRLGDPTAWLAGRITLNPLKHIDPVGTLLLPLVILATSFFTTGHALLFGWAKPVPVNFRKLRNPKKDMLWVALAGPAANLFMALSWAALFKVITLAYAFGIPRDFLFLILRMCSLGISINLVLMVFNLLPIPPLDGGRIAVSLLPHQQAIMLSRLERFGFFIVLALLFSGLFELFLWPVVDFINTLIIHLFQI